ncbi:hypothetical protein DL93DRAFT_2216530 [Clavulina sp. PMI_390]|nr:hypothetical protein DL93DRAFT_2216530 [Clavulina sp. PMI_390]
MHPSRHKPAASSNGAGPSKPKPSARGPKRRSSLDSINSFADDHGPQNAAEYFARLKRENVNAEAEAEAKTRGVTKGKEKEKPTRVTGGHVAEGEPPLHKAVSPAKVASPGGRRGVRPGTATPSPTKGNRKTKIVQEDDSRQEMGNLPLEDSYEEPIPLPLSTSRNPVGGQGMILVAGTPTDNSRSSGTNPASQPDAIVGVKYPPGHDPLNPPFRRPTSSAGTSSRPHTYTNPSGPRKNNAGLKPLDVGKTPESGKDSELCRALLSPSSEDAPPQSAQPQPPIQFPITTSSSPLPMSSDQTPASSAPIEPSTPERPSTPYNLGVPGGATQPVTPTQQIALTRARTRVGAANSGVHSESSGEVDEKHLSSRPVDDGTLHRLRSMTSGSGISGLSDQPSFEDVSPKQTAIHRFDAMDVDLDDDGIQVHLDIPPASSAQPPETSKPSSKGAGKGKAKDTITPAMAKLTPSPAAPAHTRKKRLADEDVNRAHARNEESQPLQSPTPVRKTGEREKMLPVLKPLTLLQPASANAGASSAPPQAAKPQILVPTSSSPLPAAASTPVRSTKVAAMKPRPKPSPAKSVGARTTPNTSPFKPASSPFNPSTISRPARTSTEAPQTTMPPVVVTGASSSFEIPLASLPNVTKGRGRHSAVPKISAPSSSVRKDKGKGKGKAAPPESEDEIEEDDDDMEEVGEPMDVDSELEGAVEAEDEVGEGDGDEEPDAEVDRSPRAGPSRPRRPSTRLSRHEDDSSTDSESSSDADRSSDEDYEASQHPRSGHFDQFGQKRRDGTYQSRSPMKAAGLRGRRRDREEQEQDSESDDDDERDPSPSPLPKKRRVSVSARPPKNITRSQKAKDKQRQPDESDADEDDAEAQPSTAVYTHKGPRRVWARWEDQSFYLARVVARHSRGDYWVIFLDNDVSPVLLQDLRSPVVPGDRVELHTADKYNGRMATVQNVDWNNKEGYILTVLVDGARSKSKSSSRKNGAAPEELTLPGTSVRITQDKFPEHRRMTAEELKGLPLESGKDRDELLAKYSSKKRGAIVDDDDLDLEVNDPPKAGPSSKSSGKSRRGSRKPKTAARTSTSNSRPVSSEQQPRRTSNNLQTTSSLLLTSSQPTATPMVLPRTSQAPAQLKSAFARMIIIMTGLEVRDKNSLTTKIRRAGGKLVDDFSEIIKVGEGRNQIEWTGVARSSDVQQIVVVAPSPLNSAKYMMALALGIPCVSFLWVMDRLNGSDVNFRSYLLAAGESEYLRQPVSQSFDPRWGIETLRLARLEENPYVRQPFAECAVLLFFAKTESMREDTRRAVAAAGAPTAEVVSHLGDAKDSLDTYDYLVVVHEEKNGKVTEMVRQAKQAIAKCNIGGPKLVDNRWIKQCIIMGGIQPLPGFPE